MLALAAPALHLGPLFLLLADGIVRAVGCLGGFFLLSAIGVLKDVPGSFGAALLCFAQLVLSVDVLLLEFRVQLSSK